MRQKVTVIGGGLAGSEAALQLAKQGIEVDLYEMRPVRKTEAHTTSQCAELVCSNSFGSLSPNAASKILKDEIRKLGSFILEAAMKHAVPAGQSLAVDRDKFSQEITSLVESSPQIRVIREEVTALPLNEPVIVATGPLTSPELTSHLGKLVGQNSLYFYDAISPIVSADSLDFDKMYFANRYGKGETADFLNIPLTHEQYEELVTDLLTGDVVLPHEFEEAKYFESCMPIEAIAARGRQTLAFGPLKPVGLEDPRTGKRPHAVIQLRTENQYRTAYNLVGFQTKLKYKEQERVFRKLPGLEEAEFLRLGSMHRNTYLDSPRVLTPTLALKSFPQIFIAGQLTGTEGYLESSATGLVAGLNAARYVKGQTPLTFPADMMLGALLGTITDATKKVFQPINSNIGILPPLEFSGKKRNKVERNALMAQRSQTSLDGWLANQPLS